MIALGSLLAAGCTSLEGPPAATSIAQASTYRCGNTALAVDTDFAAGALESCLVDDAGNIAITIGPEDAPPINCSPWYAFRVTPRAAGHTRITLSYSQCGHRYWPKVSRDGNEWDYLPAEAVEIDEAEGLAFAQIDLDLDLDGAPIFVAAQELITPATYEAWLSAREDAGAGRRFSLGQSTQGREIGGIAIGNPAAREQIVLVGRQHPPEVTGALAMFPFMETIASDHPLATVFRERFVTLAVPLLNPDGVVHGHWRHNSGGVDLNRDWGPFSQPETQLMQALLAEIQSDPDRQLRLMLDFHSTQNDVFYTIPDELPTQPELFTRDWLARYAEKMPGYDVNRDARHTVGRPVSKAYVYDTYGVPGVTFELGDETDRALIDQIGEQAALAMMETLLATPQ